MTKIDEASKAFTKSKGFEKIKKTIDTDAFKKTLKVTNKMPLFVKAGLVGGTIALTGTAVRSLFDSDKGSMTNRTECAKEHLKNDAGFLAKTGLVGGAAYIVSKNKNVFKPLISGLGKTAGKLLEKASKYMPKLGGLADKILKNPTKAGVAGLVGGGAIYLVNELFKNIFKSGQIDQKYNDKAEQEAVQQEEEQAVNDAKEAKRQQIIEQLRERQEYIEKLKNGENPVMEYYKNGGRGIY